MKNWALAAAIISAMYLGSSNGIAQQPATPAANPLDVVPDKMPFNTPYGPPISAQRAQGAVQAAMAEATNTTGR